MSEIIVGLVGALSTIVCSAATFFFTRKKYNAEVDAQKIRNMNDLLDFYIKLCDDTNRRVLEIQRENDSLREKVEKIDTKLIKLQNMVCYKENCLDRVFEDSKVTKKVNGNGTKSTKKVEKE